MGPATLAAAVAATGAESGGSVVWGASVTGGAEWQPIITATRSPSQYRIPLPFSPEFTGEWRNLCGVPESIPHLMFIGKLGETNRVKRLYGS